MSAYYLRRRNRFHFSTVILTFNFDDVDFELGLDRVKMNRRAKYSGRRTFRSKVIVRTYRHRHTIEHIIDRLLSVDH